MPMSGRIVNVASLCGTISLAQLGGYSASKFAVEALSDAWRRDLQAWAIPVSVIEPGTTGGTALWKAAISDAHVENTWEKLPAATKQIYEKKHLYALRDASQTMLGLLAGDSKHVIDAMEDALLCRWPQARYPIGIDTALLSKIGLLPDAVSDTLLAWTMPTLEPPAKPTKRD